MCVVLSARPRSLQGCRFVRCSIVDVNSVWGLDLRQTGRQSLSSQQPTSLSATLAATKSIMFGLLCHFQHRGEEEGGGGVPSIFYSFRLSWMVRLQSGQHAKQKREGLPIWKPWVNPVAFWARGDWGWGRRGGRRRWETVVAMPLPASARRQSIPQCCWHPWPSCYGCSWHIPRDSSHSLLFGVVSCEWTFSQSEDKWLDSTDVTFSRGPCHQTDFLDC